MNQFRSCNVGCVDYLVDEGALLADIEPGVLLVGASLDIEEGCVLVLVPQTAFVASEDGLSVEPSKR